ncbi:retrovirus-related pol polyprotein from transposon TNT 1-94, partial [Tanacetum coccineum]
MTTLAEHIIVAGAENRPPMLEKSMYDSWESRIRLFIKGKKHGRMMLDSIDNGPLVYLTVEENGQTRPKKYSELIEAQQLQDDCDVQATNIILHGLPPDVLVVPMFQQGEDPIECINKAIAFLSAVASRFPPSNNQLRTSSNPRNKATILDDGQPRVVKCYNCQGEGHIVRQCTQPKRPRNAAWFKEKLMLAEAQEAGQILDEEQLAFLADPIDDLDAYDSDFDDLSSAKAVLMANLSSYNEIHSDSNIIPYSQYLQESQDAVIQDTNPYAPNDLLVLSLVEQMITRSWGFEHTKECFVTEIIPFLKVLKGTFNAFDKTLLDEITKVQTVFNQMEAAVDQCSVDKNVFEIQIKQLRIDNDQLLNQIMSQEIMHIVVNSVDILDVKKSCVYDCNQFDSIRKTRVQSKEHCDSLIAQINEKFDENSDLNAQLQEKVFAITALKNELRKLKGKNIVNTAVSKPNATIALGMFKLDIELISFWR